MQTFLFLNQRRRVRLTCLSVAIGCLVFGTALAQNAAPAATGATGQSPTYLRDIQPIFMGNCSRCHNQQSHFVYNWLDYKTAFADRWEIRRRVWDSYQGSYYKEAMPIANSPESLARADEDRRIIRDWVNSGSPQGVEPSTRAGGFPNGRQRRFCNRASYRQSGTADCG